VLAADGERPPVDEGGLTPREIEVVCELALNRTTDQIAESLRMAPETVRTHVKAILRKLNVNSRQDAVLKAKMKGVTCSKPTG
jgi:DNA-binding CsgD family transcriptional regulator